MSHPVVVVGFGTMGDYHTRRIAEVDGLHVAGIVDIDEAATKDAVDKGLRVYPDLADALADDEIEVVLIATPNDSHHPIAMAALAAGKHVLCEKPVMLDSAHLAEVVDAAERAGRLFMVHQNRRWDPDYLAMRQVLDDGTIGDVTYVETRVHGSRGIPGDWRAEKARGGGMVLDWGVHLVDRLLLMVDAPVTQVFGRLSYTLGHDVDDGFKAYLTFGNGLQALVDVSTTNFAPLPKSVVQSNTGTAVVEDWEMNGRIVRLGDEDEADAEPVQAGAGMTKTMAPRVKNYADQAMLDDSVEVLPLPRIESDVRDWYRNAVAVIEGRAEPVVTTAQNLRVLRLLEAVVESDRTGQVVTFEPAAQGA